MFIQKLTRAVVHDFDTPLASTTSGKLRGILCEGTYIFRGVPYATAKRFHPPKPVSPWEGVREATFFGFMPPELRRYDIGGEYVVRHVYLPQDEDCLSLNLWTPSLEPSARLPVLVWLHGGGFDEGSGINHYAYDGEEMSRFGNVVVVSVNHRLNVLGYLDLSAYGAEYENSGNLGQQDLVTALEWVRDNIAAFGGDPGNVTIFGQSGGGGKVTTLMQMPAADGLYHRAIVMSGVFGTGDKPLGDDDAATARRLAARVMELAGARDVKALEALPYHELASATNAARDSLSRELGRRVGFHPVADGRYYVGDPFDVGFRAETAHIPLMVGSVLSEFWNPVTDPRAACMSKYRWGDELLRELLERKFGSHARAVAQTYRQAYPGRTLADVLSMDALVRKASVAFCQLRAGMSDAGVYNYLFCLEYPDMGGQIPTHNCDIPYVFHNAQYLEPFYEPGVTEPAQDLLCGAFVNFARTGDPNGEHVPEWKPMGEHTQATMVVDRQSACRIDHDKALMALLPAELPWFAKLSHDDAPQQS